MKVISYSSLCFVSLPRGPLLLQGNDDTGKLVRILPLFEDEEIAIQWVERHQKNVPIGIIPIRDASEFLSVLTKAKQDGCNFVSWDRGPHDDESTLQKIHEILKSLDADPETN